MNFSYPRRILYSTILMGLVSLLLVLAWLLPTVEREVKVVDTLFVLDITDSMNVKDVMIDGEPVSRLQWAKDYTRRTLLDLPCGTHAGLAVFTEARSLVLINPVEVCANYHDLGQMLEQVDRTMAWARASEVSKAVFTSIKQVQHVEPKPSIVFLTDGHESPPLHETLYPKFKGTPGKVKGVFVGIGGDDLQPIPKSDEHGNIDGVWGVFDVLQHDVYSRGPEAGANRPKTEHLSSQKKTHLEELAVMVGFDYLSSPTKPSQLVSLIKDNSDGRKQLVDYDLGPWLGFIALLFLVLVYLPYAMVMRTE